MAIRNWPWGVVLVLVAAALLFAGALSPRATAANAQMVITWRATHSYVPPMYEGKALSNQASNIIASAEVFAGNQRADLSKVTIYWYLDDTLLGGGPGARSMTFSPFGGASDSEILRVEMPDYSGGLLMSTTQIPIARPAVVIVAPYPGGIFSANPFVIKALPYFFNITSANQLGLAWSVNEKAVSSVENPDELQATLGPGTTAGSNFDVQLSAVNSADSTSASDEKAFTYQPLP